jgi:tetratricopeptide (TPR) repeat protein
MGASCPGMHPPTDRSISSSRRSKCLSRVLAAALAAQLALAPSLAAAGGPSATELKARADAAMDGGAFATAIEGYRASFELSHSPALLYNIGNAYERLGDYPNALIFLQRFSWVAPPELKARVPQLDELVESVRAKLAVLVVHCSVPGARVLVRGAWRGTTPLAGELTVMPGTARVEIVADGYRPFARELVLPAGGEARVDAILVPELVALRSAPATWETAERAKSEPITAKWWFWTGVGLVVAGGATAAVVALTRQKSAPSGDIAPGQVAAPLMSW